MNWIKTHGSSWWFFNIVSQTINGPKFRILRLVKSDFVRKLLEAGLSRLLLKSVQQGFLPEDCSISPIWSEIVKAWFNQVGLTIVCPCIGNCLGLLCRRKWWQTNSAHLLLETLMEGVIMNQLQLKKILFLGNCTDGVLNSRSPIKIQKK